MRKYSISDNPVYMKRTIFSGSVYRNNWDASIYYDNAAGLHVSKGCLVFAVRGDDMCDVLRCGLSQMADEMPAEMMPTKENQLLIMECDSGNVAATSCANNNDMVKRVSVLWLRAEKPGKREDSFSFMYDVHFAMPEYSPAKHGNQLAWLESTAERINDYVGAAIIGSCGLDEAAVSPDIIIKRADQTYLYSNYLSYTIADSNSWRRTIRYYAELTVLLNEDGSRAVRSLDVNIRVPREDYKYVRCTRFQRRRRNAYAIDIACDNAMCIQGVGVDSMLSCINQYCQFDSDATEDDAMREYEYDADVDASALLPDASELDIFNTADEEDEEEDEGVRDDGVAQRHNYAIEPIPADSHCLMSSIWGIWNTYFIHPEVTQQIIDVLNSRVHSMDEKQINQLASEVMTECLNQTVAAFNIFT